MKRKVIAIWNGGGADGTGVLTAQSGAFDNMPYSFKTRFENDNGKLGTNPEELIAAAHAGCFNMKLSFVLNEANFNPEELKTEAILTFIDGKIISIEKNGDGIVPKNICEVAASLPRLFIKAIRRAGTIPTKGPTNGIRLASPAMIPINITSVILAPKKFNNKRPAIDIPATLAADKNWPLK